MRFLIICMVMMMCLAKNSLANTDVQTQLQTIATSIRAAELQSDKIQNEIARLEAEKQPLLNTLETARYDVARHLSALHHLEQSPNRFGFLLPDTSYLDFHYRLRAYQTRKDILSTRLNENYFIFKSIEDKQVAIQNYIDDRNTLSLAVNALIENIKDINDTRDDINIMVQDLTDKNMSLNQFISNVIDMPYRPDSKLPLVFSPPASGVIQIQNNNEITISTAMNALVTSPAQGVVAYADDFSNLGNIIIINHGKGYVSILRPFDKILVKQGMIVIAGEPLGIVQSNNNNWEKDGKTPMLYYALRYNEESINPLTKFSGL